MSNNATGYRPIDSKREEFRKYLEKAGIMDALTKILVMLYEEVDKPQDALDYVIKNLCADRPETLELETLRSQMEIMTAKVQKLEARNADLKKRLEAYEPVEDPEEAGEEGVASSEEGKEGTSPPPSTEP